MKNKILAFITILNGIIGMTSCKKFVDVGPPKNQLVANKAFADSASANSAIAGIYVDMIQSFGFGYMSGGLTAYPGLSADELAQTTKDPDINQLYSNQISVQNSYNAILWANAYKYLYDANACIQGITASSTIPPTAKAHFLAEAMQIRAFLFFNLTNLYGAVPLVRTTDYHITQSLARAPIDSVYAQILSDLNFAKDNLPKNISAERASYYSAVALTAKVQLYRKNYAAAEAAATKVITSGRYLLETDLNSVFLATSAEAIWKIIPVFPGIETWEGYDFVPSDPNAAPQFIINNALLNAFEPGDIRKSDWLNSNSVGGLNYYYPFKYKAATTTGAPTENYVILRLGEQYLIRAEARANQNNISGAQADINIIRNRAGLANTTANNMASLLLAIEQERRVELFCEWGNRWFDLQRTNRADQVLAPVKSNWTHNAILYPVPEAEIKSNPALTQNTGY